MLLPEHVYKESFTPKSQMHISVSYCTLVYVMVNDA